MGVEPHLRQQRRGAVEGQACRRDEDFASMRRSGCLPLGSESTDGVPLCGQEDRAVAIVCSGA